MNKKILIIIGIIIGTAFLALVFVWLSSSDTQLPIPNPGQGTATSTFPIPGHGINPDKAISVETANGDRIQTKDFLKDPETVSDPVNNGYYYLGYHFIEGATKEPPYVIEYIDATDFFNIGLFQEPIAKYRQEAEQYLMSHLGISQSQMCNLKYSVGVPSNVSQFYGSMELGFSFCPGAVQIPG